MTQLLQPSSAINDLRTQAHLQLSKRLQDLDLTGLLIYTIVNAPESILPYLAWQFNIDQLAAALVLLGVDYETVIANAFILYQKAGSAGSISSILAMAGIEPVVVQEGQAAWGGSSYPANQGWAAFRVRIGPTSFTPTTQQLVAINTIIQWAKPARCLLDALIFIASLFVDDATPQGVIDGVNQIFVLPYAPVDTAHVLPFLNGLFLTEGIDYTLSGTSLDMLYPVPIGSEAYPTVFRIYYLIDAGETGFVQETPSGALNGINVDFNLSDAPNPTKSLQLFKNGILQKQGVGFDYVLSSDTITYATAPASTDTHKAIYRVTPISITANFADAETPDGVIDGSNVIFTIEHEPDPPSALQLYCNGLIITQGADLDYILNGLTITVAEAPGGEDEFTTFYRY